jgi:hypothetical protein
VTVEKTYIDFCRVCEDFTSFYKSMKACRVCVLQRNSLWAKSNAKLANQIAKRWKDNNPARYRESTQKHYRKKRGQIEKPTRPQPIACEWPGCVRSDLKEDHDHATGLFRGWLCNRHNLALGGIGDTVDALRAGLRYLESKADASA